MLKCEALREALQYDPQTGEFTSRVRRGRLTPGARVGSTHRTGYRTIKLCDQLHQAHRLAWLYVHGEWPPGMLDHINGIKTDNRITNLRVATGSQNNVNRKKLSQNTSGARGVTWNKSSGKWQAALKVNGKCRYLGVFENIEAASAAYRAAAVQQYGEFAQS
ncbi:MAG: HNH endonuclease [Hyphomicrobium sp.]|uniref:HNH endonuclease signature motif containing protein n=1 Tax=Hyphomicrobium sp. TaxID=82 RepID=UPI00344F2FB9|nr:HNH endonuclease [Hyphomicrobium sp.]